MKENNSQKRGSTFIIPDSMVMTILVFTSIALAIIAVAVGLIGDNPFVVWMLTITLAITIAGIVMIRLGYPTPTRILLPLLLMTATAIIAYNRGGLYHISMLGFPVVIVLSGMLLSERWALGFATIGSFMAAGIGYTDIKGISPFSATSRTGYDDIAVAIAMFFLTAIVLQIIMQRLTEINIKAEEFATAQESANIELKKLQNELELRVEERTKELQRRTDQFQTIENINRSINTLQSIEQLLPAIAGQVSEQFGYYHVGLFLLDAQKEYAVLSASNSEPGKRMLARGHKLRVGEQGLVGYATLSGKTRTALKVGDDAVYFNNPELPETRSEVVIPLKYAKQVIGALDIQSRENNAFSQGDVDLFSILADQISIAIQNVRSTEQTQKALQEAEQTARQLTSQTWGNYTETIKSRGYKYDGLKPEPIRQKTTSQNVDGSISIPVELRGQAIGQLKLKTADPNRPLSQDERTILESTAERVAIAMEGARLLEEAQKRAKRETTISEISAKLSASFQLDSILRDTVEELGQTLNNTTVTFQLVNPSTPSTIKDDKTASSKRDVE